MVRYFVPDQPFRLRKLYPLFLASCWILGLVCGISDFFTAGSSLTSLMRSISSGAVSIVSVLCAVLLPFLLTIFLVSFRRPSLIFSVCFCKAFLFSFLSAGILVQYGTAGWLFRCLLLFCDIITVPVLYFFWLRNVSRIDPLFGWIVLLMLAIAILAAGLNYRIILPALACLIEF